jgi:two-component system sensor histidine kinase KdpD
LYDTGAGAVAIKPERQHSGCATRNRAPAITGHILAAVSHDLRTPLAVVVGAASALQLQHAKLSTAEQEHLLDSIIKEAGYLSALTENTCNWCVWKTHRNHWCGIGNR